MKRTILITGASSGIGKATAKLFSQNGWNVIATMRHPEKEEELNKLNDIMVTRLDVTDAESISGAVAAGVQRFGKIDALLNNAGFGAYGPLEVTPFDKIKRQFDTNVFGVLQTIKAVLPHFRSNRSGVIVNISSMGGKIGFPLGTLYHGTKFAIEGLSEALSYEMAEIGVKVKIVEPGMTKTDFGGRSLDFSNNEDITEYQEIVKKVFAGFDKSQANASEPSFVAGVVYQAVMDDSSKLRYSAGQDAEALLTARQSKDDASLFQGIRKMFAL